MEWVGAPRGVNGQGLSWREINALLSGSKTRPLIPVEHLPDRRKKSGSSGSGADFGPVGLPAACGGGGVVGADGVAAVDAGLAFAELHACSSYNFLRGASDPEAFIARAVELGLGALALIDTDGLYGAARTAQVAREVELPIVYGAELSHPTAPLTLLCEGAEGYVALSHIITAARMAAGEKDRTVYPDLKDLADASGGHLIAVLDAAWIPHADQLVAAFGAEHTVVELPATLQPSDADHHQALRAIAADYGLPITISTRPTCATRHDARLAGAKAALARRASLEDARGSLHPMGGTWLVDGATLLRRHPDCADAIATSAALARRLAFPLQLIAPELPPFDTPDGVDEYTHLAQLTRARARERYASRTHDVQQAAAKQIDHELAVIRKLNFPGYFLIVCDLVDFCKSNNILCQGRGSAANSAVCFALGITNVEPISAGLLFERFLSPDRDGPPDIDIDIESGRREEVIQYVYSRYGRDNAAQVANVITYRHKGAVRDAARALGYPQGACDAFSRGTTPIPDAVEELAEDFLGQPRHLGIHSGGMVICDRPIADVVPVEWARKKDRSIIQWDKDDCAYGGLVKFDLLGLGMLEALHHCIDLVATHHGHTVNLWELDLADPAVYEMLARADAVGVFQVESRAQMATLPRLKPRTFFDLVVEVALIRPGPIQGGSVHPYIRRRNGQEAITYDHPCLEKALEKTLGIPLFQEQLMQIAKDAAGFSGAEADTLRRAMGSKRSPEKMARLKQRFYQGLKTTHNIDGATADTLWNKMVAFAAYGFPESHSQSFASLVYYSAWFKLYYPAEFCAALLKAQPMGFYSPQSLISDARRHGVKILPISVQHSPLDADSPDGCVRLGLNLIRGLGETAARAIVDARTAGGPFTSAADLARRANLTTAHMEALARAGALDSLGLSRRQALWEAGVAATEKDTMLPGLSAIDTPTLPGMNAIELLAQDISTTGVTHHTQPISYLRTWLDERGVIPANRLLDVPDGSRITIAGVVTHRQRPGTAGGTMFFGLEDDTGLMNVVISPGLWKAYGQLARTAKALIIRGQIQNASGAATLVADKLEPLPLGQLLSTGSRDFR